MCGVVQRRPTVTGMTGEEGSGYIWPLNESFAKFVKGEADSKQQQYNTKYAFGTWLALVVGIGFIDNF